MSEMEDEEAGAGRPSAARRLGWNPLGLLRHAHAAATRRHHGMSVDRLVEIARTGDVLLVARGGTLGFAVELFEHTPIWQVGLVMYHGPTQSMCVTCIEADPDESSFTKRLYPLRSFVEKVLSGGGDVGLRRLHCNATDRARLVVVCGEFATAWPLKVPARVSARDVLWGAYPVYGVLLAALFRVASIFGADRLDYTADVIHARVLNAYMVAGVLADAGVFQQAVMASHFAGATLDVHGEREFEPMRTSLCFGVGPLDRLPYQTSGDGVFTARFGAELWVQ